MRIFLGILGAGLLAIVLVDAFTTVVLARRAQRLFRVTQIFYQFTWTPYAALARRIASGSHRENYLSIYGPLSLLTLFVCWAIGLVAGFGLLQWSVGLHFRDVHPNMAAAIYFSATVLTTLGLAEPSNVASKFLMVSEAVLGLSFLALVLSYLPVFYQSFSSRELRISLLDAVPGRRLPLQSSCSAKVQTRRNWNSSWRIGKSGRPSFSKASFPTQCWRTFVRNMEISPG